MPAQRKVALPPVQLRESLERSRAESLTFDEAWNRAVGTARRRGEVRFPHATVERRFWRAALASQRGEWLAAWEGRETPTSRALRELFGVGYDDWSALARMRSPDNGRVEEPRMALAPILPPRGLSRAIDSASRWPETRELAA